MYLRRTALRYCSLALLSRYSSAFIAATKWRTQTSQDHHRRASLTSGKPCATLLLRVLHEAPAASRAVSRQMSTATEDALEVRANFEAVRERVAQAAAAAGTSNVRLVAVSKTKPMELLEAAYAADCRCFGENYVQELVEKANLWKDRVDVQWHFIGALQSNKCGTLVNNIAVSRLTIETVSSAKLANKLHAAVINGSSETDKTRLRVFVQVNTSGEDSKSGVEPDAACVELCRHIVDACPGLELRGLMTIGAPNDAGCFTTLVECRDQVQAALGSAAPPMELSMGMSGDYENAIVAGATNVRVGSTIFGHRDYSNSSTPS